MPVPKPVHNIVYVTSSKFKREENEIFVRTGRTNGGEPVSSRFRFEMREAKIKEIIEVDLRVMVQAEVAKAYSELKVPCIVEHAGLVFEDFIAKGYPGGLTKPMWDTLGDSFIKETHSEHRKAIARAVVA